MFNSRWFFVSLVANLYPLYLSIGILGRRFRVILLFFHFFWKNRSFFHFFSDNIQKCCKMCLHSANLGTRSRAIAMQRVLNIRRHLLASFVWFRVSLVANLYPLYLSIGIFGRRFRVILLFFHFFLEKPVFFSLFLSNSRKIWEKCAKMMEHRPSLNEDERVSRA